MKIYQLSVEDALTSLHTEKAGLTAAEAARRLQEFGANRIERQERKPQWRKLLKSLTHLFALVLWAAAALALCADLLQPGEGMAALSVAILGVILINGFFSWWQEYRAERAILALQRLLPRKVKALRDGSVAEVDADALVPGDIVLVEAGDDVPADCRIIESYGARANSGTLTGESVPQTRDAKPSAEESLLQSRNLLLAGTQLTAGEARAAVFATGMHTEFGRIAHLTQSGDPAESPLLGEIRTLSRLIAILAVGLGSFFFVVGRGVGLSFEENLMFAIGIIVANVPEGLLPTVTLALAMGAQRMARRNALIRHLPAVESLGSATVICTDKTGTLTLNRMTVSRLFLDGRCYAVPEALADLKDTHGRFFEVAGACHSLEVTGDAWLGDPLEVALVELAEQAGLSAKVRDKVDEIPFDSERRRLSTLHRAQQGLVLYTKGALESLLPISNMVQLGDDTLPLDDTLRANLLRAEARMAADGLRVLALAFRDLGVDNDRANLEASLTLLGLVGLKDRLRPEVPAAIRRCREAGIKLIMITGDHPKTAVAIGREGGLIQSPEPRVITGDRLSRLTSSQLQLALESPEIIFARVSAEQKLVIVEALKRKRHIVAVTGDGVNDAPALKAAHIGVAMGVKGTDVAKEAADMVLLDDNFASIVGAIEEGRAVFENVRKFLTYILTSNIPEIIPYLAFALFKIPLPLTIIQILAVDVGTDLVPALGLGAEPPERDAMRKPPRRREERLIDTALLARAYLFLGAIEACAAMAVFFFVMLHGGWKYGQSLSQTAPLYLQGTTACLSTIVVMQMINVYLCRDRRESILTTGILGNGLIVWGVALEVALILFIDYTAWGNKIFGAAPIPVSVWVLAAGFAMAMLVLEEMRKYLFRLNKRSTGFARRRLSKGYVKSVNHR